MAREQWRRLLKAELRLFLTVPSLSALIQNVHTLLSKTKALQLIQPSSGGAFRNQQQKEVELNMLVWSYHTQHPLFSLGRILIDTVVSILYFCWCLSDSYAWVPW